MINLYLNGVNFNKNILNMLKYFFFKFSYIKLNLIKLNYLLHGTMVDKWKRRLPNLIGFECKQLLELSTLVTT